MAWSSPRTWTTGELVTASIMNAHVRDNLNALRSSNPAVSVYATSDQTIPNATWTALTWDSEQLDIDSIHNPASNPTRLTSVTSGYYLVTGMAQFRSASNAVALAARIKVNGATVVAHKLVPGCSQDGNGPTIVAAFAFNAGDYLEMEAWQNSGGNLNTYSGVGIAGPVLIAVRLGG